LIPAKMKIIPLMSQEDTHSYLSAHIA